MFLYKTQSSAKRRTDDLNCVPMREKKTTRKGIFFQAGQCAVLSSYRLGKCCFFVEKRVCFFYKFAKIL